MVGGEIAEKIGVVTLLTVAQLQRLNFHQATSSQSFLNLFIRYLLFVNIDLRAIKKASGTTNNTSAIAII